MSPAAERLHYLGVGVCAAVVGVEGLLHQVSLFVDTEEEVEVADVGGAAGV